MQDVGASKAVLVSSRGFTGKAKRKAGRLGITLCIASDAGHKLRDIGLTVPVIVTEIGCSQLLPSFSIHLKADTELADDCAFTIQDQSLEDALVDAIRSGELRSSVPDALMDWKPTTITAPYIRDKAGNKLSIEDLNVRVKISAVHYFGYVHDLPATVSLSNLSSNTHHLFLSEEDLAAYRGILHRYNSLDQIPAPRCSVLLRGIAVKPVCIETSTLRMTHVETGSIYTMQVTGSRLSKY